MRLAVDPFRDGGRRGGTDPHPIPRRCSPLTLTAPVLLRGYPTPSLPAREGVGWALPVPAPPRTQAHPRGIVRSKIGAKEASSWIHDIRRTQRSFQRRPLRAPTSCVPSTCALGCGDRRSGNKTRSQALRLSGSAGCTKATPAAHRAGTIDRRPKSRSDIAADEPAFKGDVAISRSRFRAV